MGQAAKPPAAKKQRPPAKPKPKPKAAGATGAAGAAVKPEQQAAAAGIKRQRAGALKAGGQQPAAKKQRRDTQPEAKRDEQAAQVEGQVGQQTLAVEELQEQAQAPSRPPSGSRPRSRSHTSASRATAKPITSVQAPAATAAAAALVPLADLLSFPAAGAAPLASQAAAAALPEAPHTTAVPRPPSSVAPRSAASSQRTKVGIVHLPVRGACSRPYVAHASAWMRACSWGLQPQDVRLCGSADACCIRFGQPSVPPGPSPPTPPRSVPPRAPSACAPRRRLWPAHRKRWWAAASACSGLGRTSCFTAQVGCTAVAGDRDRYRIVHWPMVAARCQSPDAAAVHAALATASYPAMLPVPPLPRSPFPSPPTQWLRTTPSPSCTRCATMMGQRKSWRSPLRSVGWMVCEGGGVIVWVLRLREGCHSHKVRGNDNRRCER